jgi:MFS family permease
VSIRLYRELCEEFKSLITMSSIWLIYFVISIQEVVVRVLTPFATSAFSLHSLTAATSIMSSIIGGLAKLPLAKLLDTWGRPQGLALSLFIWVLGFIMMAGCKNIQTYAAAQVFASVGLVLQGKKPGQKLMFACSSQGVSYCLTIFIADTTTLRNRSFMLAFATSPYIVTTWIGGPLSDHILSGPGWRWGFGIWAIIVPFVVSPLILLFLWNNRKAKEAGLISHSHGRLTLKAVKNYVIDVDLIGVIILAGGMVCCSGPET